MITNLLVAASMGLTVAFVVAWVLSPRLRAGIERPKYQFQDALDDYDRTGQRGRMRS